MDNGTGVTTMRRARAAVVPSLERERELFAAGHRFVGGVDEVGRGAIAGPVSVGIAVVDLAAPEPELDGVRDSKLLSAKKREALAPRIRQLLAGYGVGHCSAEEIDQMGIVAALRTAGLRAFALLDPAVRPTALILDGSHNWLADPISAREPTVQILPQVKADMTCLSVASASVLAKTERDALMSTLDQSAPQYQWAANKGYGTAAHKRALSEHGVSEYHRQSWNLQS